MNIRQKLLRFWNFWPPFLFSGIKILSISNEFHHIKVKLKFRFWNANYIGTQYGGSIYSMSDPFYMLMLIKALGPSYKVMDKAARIFYLKPGMTELFTEFNLTDEDLSHIRSTLHSQTKMDWEREINIFDANKELVSKVIKVIHIQKI